MLTSSGRLPQFAEHLAADLLVASLAVADDAVAGADDGNTLAVKDRGSCCARIDATAGLAHPAMCRMTRSPLGPYLSHQAQPICRLLLSSW